MSHGHFEWGFASGSARLLVVCKLCKWQPQVPVILHLCLCRCVGILLHLGMFVPLVHPFVGGKQWECYVGP